jgi:dTMP kinase
VERTIKPALAAGAWVVCDRFSDSTMAYQGWGQGADRTMIGRLSSMMGVVPDMTLILNVSEAVAAQRRFRRGGLSDRYECQDALFHARVRQGFLSIAASDPARCVLVDADGEPDDVFSAVLLAVRKRLGLALPDPRQ